MAHKICFTGDRTGKHFVNRRAGYTRFFAELCFGVISLSQQRLKFYPNIAAHIEQGIIIKHILSLPSLWSISQRGRCVNIFYYNLHFVFYFRTKIAHMALLTNNRVTQTDPTRSSKAPYVKHTIENSFTYREIPRHQQI